MSVSRKFVLLNYFLASNRSNAQSDKDPGTPLYLQIILSTVESASLQRSHAFVLDLSSEAA